MAIRDLIVLNTTQSRLEPQQGSDTVRLKGGSDELLRISDSSDVAVLTINTLSPGLNIVGTITGSDFSGSGATTASLTHVLVDGMTGDANQLVNVIPTDSVSSSAQLAVAISGSWQGEFSSSAKLFIGGGVSGSEESTGSFGLVKSTTLFGNASEIRNVTNPGTISGSASTFYSEDISDDISGSWRNILEYSGSYDAQLRSGSSDNLLINTTLSGSEASTGSFDNLFVETSMSGDGTYLTGIIPAGTISQSSNGIFDGNSLIGQEISGSFLGFVSSSGTGSDALNVFGQISGSSISTGSFDRLAGRLRGDGSQITNIIKPGLISSSAQLFNPTPVSSTTYAQYRGPSHTSGSSLSLVSSSMLLVVSTSFSGSATSTGSFDVLSVDTFTGDGSEISGLNIPSGALSSSADLTDASGSWLETSSSLVAQLIASASGLVNQDVTSGSSPYFQEVNVTDTIIYNQLVISQSNVNYTSSMAGGSTQFGDDTTDTHEMTGSLNIRGHSNIKAFRFNGAKYENSFQPSGSDFFATVSSSAQTNDKAMIPPRQSGSSAGYTLSAWIQDTAPSRSRSGGYNSNTNNYESGIGSGVGGRPQTGQPYYDGTKRGIITFLRTSMNTNSTHDGGIAYTAGRIQATDNDGGNRTLTGNRRIDDGQWHHVVLTVQQQASMSIYIDGVFDESYDSFGNFMRNRENMVIGSHLTQYTGNFSWAFDGMITDAAMHDYVMSASTVAEIYNGGAPVNLLEPVGTYTQEIVDGMWGYYRMGDVTPLSSGSAFASASYFPEGRSGGYGPGWELNNAASSSYLTLYSYGSGLANGTIGQISGSGYEVNPSVTPSRDMITVIGNISGSSVSSASFGAFSGSGDGLTQVNFTSSRMSQTQFGDQVEAFHIPTGSTEERPTTIDPSRDFSTGSIAPYVSASGLMRFNSTLSNFEGWDGINWITMVEGSANTEATTISGSIVISGSVPGQRALAGGARNSDSADTKNIDAFTISTFGNATDYGDLTGVTKGPSGLSDGIHDRGVFAGALTSATETMELISLTIPGNSVDFGDLGASGQFCSACSNGSDSVGVIFGVGNAVTMEFINIRVLGDAIDFGDSTQVRKFSGATSNGKNNRGIVAGGQGPIVSDIDLITISTKGDATKFGDLANAAQYAGMVSNDTGERGVKFGDVPSTAFMEYITISTLGDAAIFDGRLPGKARETSGVSNGVGERAVIIGNGDGDATNQTFTISTSGNAVDFGELTAVGDLHGSLSNGAQ